MRPETSETTTQQTINDLMAKNPPFIARKDHKKNPNQLELGYTITPQGQERIKEFQPEIDAYEKQNVPKKNHWERWIKDSLGALGILGALTFGTLNTINAGDKSELTKEVKQLQDSISDFRANAQQIKKQTGS